MGLPDDLLEQARHLATRERKRPKQASLRRAVSAAYYSLFHLLSGASSELIAADPKIAAALNRTLNHGEMQRVSKQFVAAKLPKALQALAAGLAASPELLKLRAVAQAFIDLQ